MVHHKSISKLDSTSSPLVPGARRSIQRRAKSQEAASLETSIGNQTMQRRLHPRALQAKLTVSETGDKFEREADRVAESVMRMPDPSGQTVQQVGGPPVIQRKCTECEEEDIQRKPRPGAEQVGSDFSHPTGGGQALPASERSFFEPRFGQDFSHVRVHSDAQADEAARSVSALAYTIGNDVVFGKGEYQPGTNSGRTLLAHELTHVVQQDAAGSEVHSPETFRAAPTAISRRAAAGTPTLQRFGDPSQAPPMLCDIANSTSALVDTNILFSLGSDTLTPTAIADIGTFIARWTAAGADDAVRIDGFASTDGPEPTNWTLSCNRALAVERELTTPSSGGPRIPTNFVEKVAQGETSEFGSALPPNRRATISADLAAVPPPPVCANPGVSRSVDLQPVFLRTGPTDPSPTGVSWSRRLTAANNIWGKIGVSFNDLGAVTIDTPLKTSGRTAAQRASIRALRSAGGVEVFLVDNDLGPGPGTPGGADTLPPIGAGCGATGNIVLSDRGASNTLLAHELGHILGIDHPTDPPPFNPGDARTIMEPSGSNAAANPPRNTMVNFARILCPAGTGSTCLNPDP